MQIGIIGLGLIGGSLGLDLRSQLGVHVVGYDISSIHLEQAINLGLVDKVVKLEELISKSDIIICAVPVHVLEKTVHKLLDRVNENQILIDTGSTKKKICQAVQSHPNRRRFVAAHPLAGTENSGPEAALSGLFRGKKNIICDAASSDAKAVSICKDLFKSVGMESFELSAEAHDKHLAYVSHLSHVSSFMLGLTVLELEKDEKQIANLASTGFESTVRLAKSSPYTWGPIFEKNSEYVCQALEQYISHLSNFLELVKNNQTEKTVQLMHEANDVRRILDDIRI